MREGWIYVMQMASLLYVKVGFSTHVDRRRLALEQNSPVEIMVLARVRGSIEDEQRIHARLTPWRTRGEWYVPSDHFISVLSDALGLSVELATQYDHGLELRRQHAEIVDRLQTQKRDLRRKISDLRAQGMIDFPLSPEQEYLASLVDLCADRDDLIRALRTELANEKKAHASSVAVRSDVIDDDLNAQIQATLKEAEWAVEELLLLEMPDPCWMVH